MVFQYGIEVKITDCNMQFRRAEAVIQIATIEIAMDHLLDMWPPPSLLPGKMFVTDPEKGVETLFSQR
jgi:hypothetical protein